MRRDELCIDASDVGMVAVELSVSSVFEPPVALASIELTKPATSKVDVDELTPIEDRLLVRLSLERRDKSELSGKLAALEDTKNEDAVRVRLGVMVCVSAVDGVVGGVPTGVDSESVALLLMGTSAELDDILAILVDVGNSVLLSGSALGRADV